MSGRGWTEMIEGWDEESWIDLAYCGSRNPAASSLDELAGSRIETADSDGQGEGDDEARPRFVFIPRGEADAEIRRLEEEDL
jgi:hypothetical protein